MSDAAPALIALDWGTSNVRAYLLDSSGVTLDLRSGESGVGKLDIAGFEKRLQEVCGDWIAAHDVPIIACGMIGSRQGWREAAYFACPANLDALSRNLTEVSMADGRRLHIVPGLCSRDADGAPDVMRGEETQLFGADLTAGSVAVLPGTHSKWAWIGESGVSSFKTYFTGEVFALLREHSLLGRVIAPGTDPAAFERGARAGLAEPDALLNRLFHARSLWLFNELPATGVADYLSGLLIGAEVGNALSATRASEVHLIGATELCERYARVIGWAGRATHIAPSDLAVRGLWRISGAAGLVA